jgi:hypothetical protein
MATSAQRGTAATLAIVAAIAGYIVTFGGHPVWGLLIQVFAVLAGILGLVMSVSPRVTGGLISLAAIILGVLGMGVAVLGILGAILI